MLEFDITGSGRQEVPRVDCSTCTALCCRGGRLPLLRDEAAALQEAGTDLTELKAPAFIPLRLLGFREPRGIYARSGDCGNLVEAPEGKQSLCGDYDNRPRACREFVPGLYACRQLRVEAGIDSPESFEAFLRLTDQGGAPQLPVQAPEAPAHQQQPSAANSRSSQ